MIGLIMLVPLLSQELDHKVGSKEEVRQANRMPLKELISEILQGFNTKPALWALLFMTISGISVGIYDVLFNKFFIEELAWTGEQIGAARPWGMWTGGAIGLLVGVGVSFYGSRYLLLGFVFLELLLYLFLGTADVELIASNGFLILLGVDIAVVGSQVIMFALLMSLCVTRTSATNFGIFMGLANFSTLIGNQIAPMSFAAFGYAGSFILGSIILIPCLFIIPSMTRSNEKEPELLIETD